MDEFVTPPGFVEYPRDRKFRPLDDIDRLELMGKAHRNLAWAYPCLCLGAMFHHFFDWRLVVLQSLLALCMFVLLGNGYVKIFRAKGWERAYAWLPPFLPTLFAAICASKAESEYSTYFGFLVAFCAVYESGNYYVAQEYRKFGFKPERRDLSRRGLQTIIADLRAKEADAAHARASGPIQDEESQRDALITQELSGKDSQAVGTIGQPGLSLAERLQRSRAM